MNVAVQGYLLTKVVRAPQLGASSVLLGEAAATRHPSSAANPVRWAITLYVCTQTR